MEDNKLTNRLTTLDALCLSHKRENKKAQAEAGFFRELAGSQGIRPAEMHKTEPGGPAER